MVLLDLYIGDDCFIDRISEFYCCVLRGSPFNCNEDVFVELYRLVGPSTVEQSLGNGSWLSSSIILVSEIYLCECI